MQQKTELKKNILIESGAGFYFFKQHFMSFRQSNAKKIIA